MALQKCDECGGPVSSKATACPKCGAPRASHADSLQLPLPKGGTIAGQMATVIAVIVFFVWLTIFLMNDKPSPPIAIMREVAQQAATASPSVRTGASWDDYIKDCGHEAQKVNQARTEQAFREKYKGKSVAWSGKVTSVSEKLGGNGFTVGVAMNPTESAFGSSDILLSASDSFKDEVVALNNGDAIRFTGKMTSQGGAILNHQVELTKLGR